MKRLLLLFLALLGALLIAAMALPFLISTDAVRQSLVERARDVTGRTIEFSGSPKVAFSPFLGIEIQDVKFSDDLSTDDTPSILSMPKLKAKLSFASALRGEVQISEIQFVRPVFHLKVYSTGQKSWAFPDGKISKILEKVRTLRSETQTGEETDLGSITNVTLGTFNVLDGKIIYDNEINGQNETITNLNGELYWPDIHSPWKITGSGIWHGDMLDISSTTNQPLLLMSGGISKVRAEIASEPLNMQFDGEVNQLSGTFWKGNYEVQSPSLGRLINLLGGDVELGSSLAEFSASGDILASDDQLQLENASIEVDGNVGQGNLRLEQTETDRMRLSGTLAYPSIDITSYWQSLKSAANKDIISSPILELFQQASVDIRISSESVVLEDTLIENFAGSILSKDGKVAVDIGNAQISDALLVGKIETSEKDSVTRIATDLNFSNVDIGQLTELPNITAVYPMGVANITVKLEAQGKNFDILSQNLEGELEFSMEEGKFIGLDFEQIIASQQSQSGIGIPIGVDGGTTNVSNFQLNTIINHGVAWIERSSFKVEEFTAGLFGKVDLRLGNLAIWTDFKSTDQIEIAPNKRYFLGGTLQNPLFVPDFFSNPMIEKLHSPSLDSENEIENIE